MAPPCPGHVPPELVVDFDVNAPPGLEQGFHESWHALVSNTRHKIVWTNRNGGHWIVTDGALLHRFFAEPAHLSNRILFVPRATAEHHKLIPTTLDAPAHTPYRKLLNNALSPRTVRRVRDDIRVAADELIQGFADRGRCDFIAEYSSIFPIRIFMALVDLPREDRERLKSWCDAIVRPDPNLPFETASGLLSAYMLPIVRARRAHPGDDLLSDLLTGEVNGSPMTEEDAIMLAVQVLIAGLDTVVNLLGFVWHYLAHHPDAQARIAIAENRSGMVEEIVRRFPVVSIARLALEDITVDGVTIRADDVVAMPTMAHGLDPLANARPMELDFTRGDPRHSTFGNGPHRCPGAHLARTEILTSLDAWFARIPAFAFAGDEPVRMHGGIVGTVESLPLRW